MATLVAIGYPDQDTAEQARQTVQGLEAELIIQADPVAAISRDPEGKYHVTTMHPTGGGAAWGGFWGLLFGVLFFVPIAGLALGAGMGALFGHLGVRGIDKVFQEQGREHLKPGTSALFLVIEHVTPDKATAALSHYGGTVIKTSLSDEDTKKLQEARRRLSQRPPERLSQSRRPGCRSPMTGSPGLSFNVIQCRNPTAGLGRLHESRGPDENGR